VRLKRRGENACAPAPPRWYTGDTKHHPSSKNAFSLPLGCPSLPPPLPPKQVSPCPSSWASTVGPSVASPWPQQQHMKRGAVITWGSSNSDSSSEIRRMRTGGRDKNVHNLHHKRRNSLSTTAHHSSYCAQTKFPQVSTELSISEHN
jgi:hypothetical protein